MKPNQMTLPFITKTNSPFFQKVLKYHGIDSTTTVPNGDQLFVPGFDEYNHIAKINWCFSNRPSGDLSDRTQTVKFPWKKHINRPWSLPDVPLSSFGECCSNRVSELWATADKINLLWSGGIDSTSVLIAFLKHGERLKDFRVIYTPSSIKEHPGLYIDLVDRGDITLIDYSGDVYMNDTIDGLYINGDPGDDITASLDESFFAMHKESVLTRSWQDFFLEKTGDVDFVNFCEQYFKISQREIKTVLEARWWFYLVCKTPNFLAKNQFYFHSKDYTGFYDAKVFEDFMYYNTNIIVEDPKKYTSYKQFMKRFILEHHQDETYYRIKTKQNNTTFTNDYGQLFKYLLKKQALTSSNHIMMLADKTVIKTDNMPLLSEKEYRLKYGNTLNYLFET